MQPRTMEYDGKFTKATQLPTVFGGRKAGSFGAFPFFLPLFS